MRQAEEAIRSERLDEALRLANRPEVVEHRRAVKLRDRIAEQLAKRAGEHLRCGHSQAAWQDFRKAQEAGARPAVLDPLRGALLGRATEEIGTYLDAGNPRQALAVAEKLANVDSSRLRQLHTAAELWASGERQRRVGRFAEAIQTLQAAQRHLGNHPMLQQQLDEIRAVEKQGAELRDQLQAAVADQNWPEVVRSAGLLLELAPECREARLANQEAWRRLGIPIGATGSPAETLYAPRLASTPPGQAVGGLSGRFILWIDGVAGYLVCTGKSVTVGQAAPGSSVDIPIFGDLSRLHATFVRDGEGYLVQGRRELRVNGRPTSQAVLANGDAVRFGPSVELQFLVPNPMSSTARLNLVSRHRLQLSLAGIVLMAETCILGSSENAHIVVPHASCDVVLYGQGGALWCRADEPVQIDDQSYTGRGPLGWSSRVSVGEVSLSVEPLGSPLQQV